MDTVRAEPIGYFKTILTDTTAGRVPRVRFSVCIRTTGMECNQVVSMWPIAGLREQRKSSCMPEEIIPPIISIRFILFRKLFFYYIIKMVKDCRRSIQDSYQDVNFRLLLLVYAVQAADWRDENGIER
jgi:hypothetical protein